MGASTPFFKNHAATSLRIDKGSASHALHFGTSIFIIIEAANV